VAVTRKLSSNAAAVRPADDDVHSEFLFQQEGTTARTARGKTNCLTAMICGRITSRLGDTASPTRSPHLCEHHYSSEICHLLIYYAAQSGNSVPTMWDNQSVPSSRVKKGKKTPANT
jgi:hypothetical protein